MALSIDAIRNFEGTDRILVGRQGDLQSVNRGQRFRSFFDIGDARQRNAETLTAIHQAILNDPRYFARDVQLEAARLLEQVRTDRAIGAAEIKSIIARLDAMSLPEQRRDVVREIVTGHMATRGIPDFLPQGGGTAYVTLAREDIAMHEPTNGGFGHMDYNSALDAFDVKMRNVFARLGTGTGDEEALARFASLNARSSALEINAATIAFMQVLRDAHAGLQISDDGEIKALQGLLARSAVATWPDDVKAGVLAALESDAGKNLLAFYASEGASSEAGGISSALSNVVVQLKTSLGRPNPQEPIPLPAEPDATQLPPRVLAQFSLAATASGSGAGTVKDLIGKIEQGGPANVSARQAKMAATCHSMIVTNVTQQISQGLFKEETDDDGAVIKRTFNPDKTGTQFDKDLLRGTPVRLPGGQPLSQDPARARDELVRFVTGDANATCATASTADKMKASIIATCMNQSIPGIAMSAYGECLNDDPTSAYSKFTAVSNTNLDRDEVFELSKDPNGDVKLHFISRRPVKAIAVDGNVEMLALGSFDEYEMDITFPAGNLDALATADWSKYDHTPVNTADKNKADVSRHISAADLVPDEFKFTGTVSMYPHVHFIEA